MADRLAILVERVKIVITQLLLWICLKCLCVFHLINPDCYFQQPRAEPQGGLLQVLGESEEEEEDVIATAPAEPQGGLLQVPGESEEEEEDGEIGDLRNAEVEAYDLCWRWLQGFSDSKFMIGTMMVLLAMPRSAGFMDFTGVLGTLFTLCRMACQARKMCAPGAQAVVFADLNIMLSLCGQMALLLTFPIFEPGTSYCLRFFYNFSCWLNWTSLFVIVSMNIRQP